jgi:hypothetical protein
MRAPRIPLLCAALLLPGVLLTTPAQAEGPTPATTKAKKTKSKDADKGASKGQLPPEDTGKLRSIEVHQPKMSDKAPPTGEAQERTANDISPATAPPSVDEDMARERVTKAMRRYQKSIDACIEAARKRNPATSGQVDLSLQIFERKVTPTVAKDTSGDAQLGACLLQAARTWELPAASLSVPWSISLAR